MIYRLLAIGGVIAVLAVGWYITHLKLDSSNKARDDALASLVISGNLIAKERENLANANRRATAYQDDRNISNAELEKLRNCVADKSCGVRVVTIHQPVPDTGTSPAGTTGTDAGHCRVDEQDYLNLRDRIAIVADRYKALQREVIARSSPDYCQTKKSPNE